MVNDQAKNAGPAAPDHTSLMCPPCPPPIPYPSPYPSIYPQSHWNPSAPSVPQDGDGVNPQMHWVFSPPPMLYPQAFTPTATPAVQRPKRKQVKMACTNCATACKRCDEARPCERCQKYNLEGSCVDGVRKERQKGIKRGPYKRKNKASSSEASAAAFSPPGSNPNWPANGVGGSTSSPGQLHPPQIPIPVLSEHSHPLLAWSLLPPPHQGHEVPSAPEGGSNAAGQPSAVAYFPFFHPGMYIPHNGVQMPQTEPSEPPRDNGQPAETESRTEGTPAAAKKRNKSGKNESRSKKLKTDATASKNATSGGTMGGGDQVTEPGRDSPADGGDT